MNFNRTKYTDLIMYILTQCSYKPGFGKTMLCSLMYFIDFNHYELYGRLMTNESYIKSKRGIRPLHFREVMNDLISGKRIFFRREAYYNRMVNKYYPTVIPNIKFSQRELEVIGHCLEKLADNNAYSITKYATGDPPIIIANPGEEIDYRYVFSRNSEYSILKKL